MMTSAGLDAEVMASQNSAMKRRFGRAAIAGTGLRKALSYDYPEIEAHTDSGETLRGSFVVVANISRYGGPFKVAPAAQPDDGELDLLVFDGKGFLSTVAFAARVLLQRHSRSPRVTSRRVRTVELRAAPGTRFQVDGDTLDEVPTLSVSLANAQLPVLALTPEA